VAIGYGVYWVWTSPPVLRWLHKVVPDAARVFYDWLKWFVLLAGIGLAWWWVRTPTLHETVVEEDEDTEKRTKQSDNRTTHSS